MKKFVSFVLVFIIMFFAISCGNTQEDMVPKAKFDEVVIELSAAKEELANLHSEMKEMQEKLSNLESYVAEVEEKADEIQIEEESIQEEEKEGLTIATEPITVPDPETQSKFVVEVTTENFLSIFEFVDLNLYDTWGEFLLNSCCFSSLLYEQGWALGEVEDFAVEFSVFGTSETITKPDNHPAFYVGENSDPSFSLLRAKGTLTFYRVKDVKDEFSTSVALSCGYIDRILPDGSKVTFRTDIDGILVY